jgi:hypothetical protein
MHTTMRERTFLEAHNSLRPVPAEWHDGGLSVYQAMRFAHPKWWDETIPTQWMR